MVYKYANIIVSIRHKSVDQVFSYKLPEKFVNSEIGEKVLVPFGRSNKLTEGFIVELSNSLTINENKLKEIFDVSPEGSFFDSEFLELAKWMKEKYYTTLSACLNCITPAGKPIKKDSLILLKEFPQTTKLTKKQTEIIDYIKNSDNKIILSELENVFETLKTSLSVLKEKNIIEIKDLTKFKNIKLKVKFAHINYEDDEVLESLETIKNTASAQAKVVEYLSENGPSSISDIKKFMGVSNSPLNTLAKNNIIVIEDVEITRNVLGNRTAMEDSNFELTENQKKVLGFIFAKSINKKPILLHGVTGSGKTEIYMQVIERFLMEGKEAILLIPEISLTPQMVDSFYSRFGNKISVTHSRLTSYERYEQWKKAIDGKISIMIGPRSAIFTPFKNLGIIIIDEEHEKTYKSESTPKYSAKEVALKRAELSGATIILGSATPCLETYQKTETKEIELIEINERINNTPPVIEIVDMRKELAEGNTSVFSKNLLENIKHNLENNQQTILFLNRRGYSTFISCRSCGHVMTCENCNVNYTYHIQTNMLVCHYCGKRLKTPKKCPKCESNFIKFFGMGTQKIEEDLKKFFPKAKLLRMDADTTTGKYSHELILNKFKNREAEILIGTQMIAKGLDFPAVSLVGIISADISLNTGDFRAAETTYQLITQVSGRAGRKDFLGKVYVQTYNPEHYSILYAQENDYKAFYAHESALRKFMNYPPFSHIFTVLFMGKDEDRLIFLLQKLFEIMNYCNKNDVFEILDPAPANISKIKNNYRWRILIKSTDEEKIKNFAVYCTDKLKQHLNTDGVTINLSLDPLNII